MFKDIDKLPEEEKLIKLSTLKLRYFTPREIANLHGFPLEFGMCCKILISTLFFRNANVFFFAGTNPVFLFCGFFQTTQLLSSIDSCCLAKFEFL